MSTLTNYKTHLDDKLGTSSTNYYDDAKRLRAINYALQKFTQDYKPQELRKKADIAIAVDADGYYVGTLPTDLSTPNRIDKLWLKSSKREFIYSAPSNFYVQNGDVYTYDYSVAAAAQRLFVNVTAATTLQVHYYADPTTLANDTDDSGLTDDTLELVAIMAAEKLFGDAHDEEGMIRLEAIKQDSIPSWANQYNQKGRRLKSKYERVNIHYRN